MKSTVEQIRARFDNDVERFSRLDTGQSATIDAPLVLELIAEAAAATTPDARAVLDIGCGAGNYALKLLERLPGLDCTLVDLSRPMLDRAVERVSRATGGKIRILHDDIRLADIGLDSHDVVIAAAVLHHLRADAEWTDVFQRIFRSLRLGGSFWVSDLVAHDSPAIQALMWRRYGEYLAALTDEAYRDHVFAYVEQEDTPRSLAFQLDLMRDSGFQRIEVLHKNSVFAAYGGVKL